MSKTNYDVTFAGISIPAMNSFVALYSVSVIVHDEQDIPTPLMNDTTNHAVTSRPNTNSPNHFTSAIPHTTSVTTGVINIMHTIRDDIIENTTAVATH